MNSYDSKICDFDDKSTVLSPNDALLLMLRLDPNRWEIRGCKVDLGDIPLFSDEDPDRPVVETTTDDIVYLDRGNLDIEVSLKHGLRHVCGCGRPYDIHKWVSNRYNSTPVMGMRTTVTICVPQVHCPVCGTYPKIPCPLVVRNCTYTKLLKLEDINVLTEQNIKSTSRTCKVGRSVTENILEDTVEEGLRTQDLSYVHTLFIDEIQSTHGQNYITMAACQDHKALCGVIGHDIESIRQIRDHIASKGCDPMSIRYVSVDMSVAYKSGVAECFPNAKLIIDHFHLIKMVNDALDKTRKRTVRELNRVNAECPKGVKYTVLYRERNQNEKHKALMVEIRLHNKELALAFDLKEEFCEIFDSKDRHEARSKAFSWYNRCRGSHIEEMMDVARRFIKRLNDVLRYFDHRISNAVSEGLNNVYKKIKSAAYGYRKEENLINMCLFRKGNLRISI